MTRKEIDKFLANTKVYVAGNSEEIQEKLFSFGYRWCDGCTEVKYTESPFLFISTCGKSFTRGSDMELFVTLKNREITAEEILALELTEPKYRPFKTQEECLAEMIKHQPFGLVEYDDIFISIVNIYNFGIEYLYYGDPASLNYTEAISHLKFIDGKPFGIKEE